MFSVSGRAVPVPPIYGVTAVAFSADGKVLATGSNGAVHLWDPAGRQIGRLSNGGPVRQLAFSLDSTRLAVNGYNGVLELWDPHHAAAIPLHGPSGGISEVVFSHDSRLLATGGDDGVVRLWDAHTGELLATVA